MRIFRLDKVKKLTKEEQLKKIDEEVQELKDAETVENELEEGLDIIQSVFSYFFVRGFTDEQIEKAMNYNNHKLLVRCIDRKETLDMINV